MPVTRRQWILGSLALAAARPLAMVLAMSGCGGSGEDAHDPILRIPIADVPLEGRLEREHGRVAVELRREDGEIRARSMFCSHQFCRVKWQADENHYLCPCDDGLFAADGSVLYGRAQKPLRELEVKIVGDEVWVDTYQVYGVAEASGR